MSNLTDVLTKGYLDSYLIETNPSTLLAIKDLSIQYKKSQTPVFTNFNCQIDAKEIVALTGASGMGKSSLLRTIVGDHSINITGNIKIFNQNWLHINNKQKRKLSSQIGYIQQSFNLVENSTVIENVLAGHFYRIPVLRMIRKKYNDNDIKCGVDCLEKVGLSDLMFKNCNELSTGQKQRVAIARVLMQNPKLILADELIATLDTNNAENIFSILQNLTNDGIAVLIVLHQAEYAKRCNRIIDITSFSYNPIMH